MTYTREDAVALLEDWGNYRKLHYSNKTQFSNAVDIEINKDAVSSLATYLHEALIDANCPEIELDFRARCFESHLRIFKDRIIIEILRSGSSSKEYT